MDIPQFRLDFPEFDADPPYTDSMITYWSTLAEKLHAEPRFTVVYNNIIELYTAHCITIQAQEIATANAGGAPTGLSGVVSSKEVGDAQIQYDTTSAIEQDAGWFNLTVYGRQYLRLAKMYGKGGMMIGASFPAGLII